MKIIITERMLKDIILKEAYDADVERINNMKASAERNYYNSSLGMKRSANFNRGKTMSDSDYQSFMTDMQNFGNENPSDGTEVQQNAPAYTGQLGDWNVGKSISWIMSNTGTKSSGNCAKKVEMAIAAGGLPKMSCKENGGDEYAHSLHKCGILRKYGFQMIGSGRLNPKQNYTTNLMPGDIMILDTNVQYKNHAAILTGKQWVSDFKQATANPYSLPADFWIYRYSGKRQATQQTNTNQGGQMQSGTR